MALHFKSCNIPFFNRRIPATKAELSDGKSSSFQLTSLPTNKWNIVRETHPNPLSNTGHLCNNLAKKLKVYKHVLRNVGENSMQGLYMVDAMQRLNIDHHFKEEIDAFLGNQYAIFSTNGVGYGHDLHEVALRFRLLRQQGHYIPAEIFGKFTGMKGRFNEKEGGDVKGMIELYEASQLRMAGEAILAEAEQFSGKILKERIAYLDVREAEFVRSVLEQPFHETLPIFTRRNFFGNPHGMNGWLGALQDVAKMDFNVVQATHQTEILKISQWWAKLGLANELKYARNQPLKWYIWSLACLTDPSLSEQRVELTKPISIIYILDDIFDIYGTLDELTLFTEVITRWDINAAERQPYFMKICFKALYDLTNDISYKVYQKYRWNPINTLRKAWGSLCKAFLMEAEWFASGKMPNAEEYLKNGIVSSGVHIVLVHIFFLLGQGLTQQTVHKIDNFPPIISSSATILRLWDDLGSAKDENQEGKDGSYIKCMMMEEQELSVKKAREVVMGKISDAWKSLNKECLCDNIYPSAFTKASLNLARMVPLMYSYDNNQCLPRLEDQVKALLYDHVPL